MLTFAHSVLHHQERALSAHRSLQSATSLFDDIANGLGTPAAADIADLEQLVRDVESAMELPRLPEGIEKCGEYSALLEESAATSRRVISERFRFIREAATTARHRVTWYRGVRKAQPAKVGPHFSPLLRPILIPRIFGSLVPSCKSDSMLVPNPGRSYSCCLLTSVCICHYTLYMHHRLPCNMCSQRQN